MAIFFFSEKLSQDMAEFSINFLLRGVNKNSPSAMLIVKKATSHTTVCVEDTVIFQIWVKKRRDQRRQSKQILNLLFANDTFIKNCLPAGQLVPLWSLVFHMKQCVTVCVSTCLSVLLCLESKCGGAGNIQGFFLFYTVFGDPTLLVEVINNHGLLNWKRWQQ